MFRRKKEKTGSRLLAVFAYLDDVEAVISRLKEWKIEIDEAYGPTRNDELLKKLGRRPSMVRYFTLTGGILGILSGWGLAAYTASQWRLLVGGKPPVPIVPYVIEAFEFCILFGVIFNLLGVLLLTRLPRRRLPAHYDPRFSVDRYGLLIRCAEGQFDTVYRHLTESGAEKVEAVHG